MLWILSSYIIRVIFSMSVVTYLNLILSGYKIEQLQVHLEFRCHQHTMRFTIKLLGIMAVSQPFLTYVMSESSVYSCDGVQDNL
jgi:hypothetical protein